MIDVSAAVVTTLGVLNPEPSQAAVEELSQREDERIEAQCERLGEDGLKQCGTGMLFKFRVLMHIL
jgi:hypothetical protein